MAHLTVARVRDIPIRLHATFLLLLPVFAYLMAIAYFRPPEGGPPTVYGWLWGALLALGLFASVLVHELAHSLVALREGVPVRSITLLPIGGVSGFEHIPRDPGKELRITIVGPLSNFAIGLPLVFLAAPVPDLLPQLSDFLFRLGALNLIVGAFNLLVPAFPMDGGRLVRALLARRMGRVRATHIASLLGQGIAAVFVVLGLLSFGAGGWLLMLIGVFVFLGARSEESSTRLTEALEAFEVRDLMTRDVTALAPEVSVETAMGEMLSRKRLVIPVRHDDGRVVGVVDLETLGSVPPASRRVATVETVARTSFDRARPGDPASEVGALLAGDEGPVLVFDAEGELVGIVTRSDVTRFTQIATALRAGGGRAAGPG